MELLAKAPNDELLCTAAQMLIDAKGQEDFGVAETMLFQMLSRRETKRNLDLLAKIKRA
jgi:hypothetical protein